jgi:hypothetical protein
MIGEVITAESTVYPGPPKPSVMVERLIGHSMMAAMVRLCRLSVSRE